MSQLTLSGRYLTVHNRDTMLVTDQAGRIGEPQTGLFHRDTRYLSNYRLTINGFDPVFLGSSRPFYFASYHYFTNPAIGTAPHLIPENSLVLKISRYVQEGVHEDIDISNHAGKPIQLSLVLEIGADFADIFQVRGIERLVPRIAMAHWDAAEMALALHYRKRNFARSLIYQLYPSKGSPAHGLSTIAFLLQLAPGETWHTCADIGFEDKPAPRHPRVHTLDNVATDLQQWQGTTTSLTCDQSKVTLAYNQAVLDLASLRLEEVEEYWYPAAGRPWYMAVFGRDALVTSIQSLIINCHFGVGTLAKLSQLQGKKIDSWTEEEPGKLPHELRRGELAATGKIPHIPYYGTADAPLLYPILLHETYRFTGEIGLLARFYHTARACLDWATNYGDIDGDGFVEYRPMSEKGYHNQGWKDAGDAVVYPDGSIVSPPIAICEIQGYRYHALRAMAEIARLMGDDGEATSYSQQADMLFERFNAVFWLEHENTYAFGLDPQKQLIATVASNPGHLLWSGIVPPDRAKKLARRLLARDMFSGWGIRTLSAENPAYDPVSYQRGSVWPHDNALIAYGLKRYGFWQDTNRIAEGIFDVSSYYEQNSLPEVFAGVRRHRETMPVPYLEANIPQAWAAGSVFLLLRAIMGFEPDPANHRLLISPTQPEWLSELTFRNLTIFNQKLDLQFHGFGLDSKVEVLRNEGEIEVVSLPGNSAGIPGPQKDATDKQ